MWQSIIIIMQTATYINKVHDILEKGFGILFKEKRLHKSLNQTTPQPLIFLDLLEVFSPYFSAETILILLFTFSPNIHTDSEQFLTFGVQKPVKSQVI